AWSPPMASSAMVKAAVTPLPLPCQDLRLSCSGRGRFRNHFAAIVMTAGAADMMRTLQLATIAAFGMGARLQRMMRPTHVALRTGLLFLRNSHDTSLSICTMRRAGRVTRFGQNPRLYTLGAPGDQALLP